MSIIRTFNFRSRLTDPNAVSIALRPPDNYNGKTYSKLAPPGDLLWRYHNKRVTPEQYTIEYNDRVLSKLDPALVAAELTALAPDPILLCVEEPGKFCHRRLVAEWLEDALGIVVSELPSNRTQMTLIDGTW